MTTPRTALPVLLALVCFAAPRPASAASCVTSAGTWQNAGFGSQSGTFTAEFDATPSLARMDGVSGLSNGAASAYSALAAAVRFNTAGTIDARNGATYSASASIPYSAGLPYHFRLVVNVPARTYSAFVRQGANAERLIGGNFAFRTEQRAVSSLANLALLASAGSEQICGLTAAGAAPADTTAPLISAVSASGVSQTGATIGWTTNENADTLVEYGPTTAYGASTPLNTTMSVAHIVAFNGLIAGTLYHYRVKSRDAAGNLATSPDFTFTTTAAAPPPPPASCVASAGTWKNAPFGAQTGSFTAEFDATPSLARMDGVAGLSNASASSYAGLAAAVRFNNIGTIDARSGAAYAAAASIPYAAGLSYRFRLVVNMSARTYSAYVRQGANAERLIGSNLAFRTEQSAVSSLTNLGLLASTGSEQICALAVVPSAPPSDIAPPVLSLISASGVTQTGATIGWTTNEPADTMVEYGLTAAYGVMSVLNTNLSTIHYAVVNGLAAGTLYHYRVKSKDAAGNLSASADYTFTTSPSATAPVISGVASSDVGINGAVVKWTTNAPSDTQVEFGPTTAYGTFSEFDPRLTTAHTAYVLGLLPSTLYHYRVRSRSAGGLSVSGDYTFTTNAATPLPPVTTNSFTDDFASYPKNTCFPDGASFGPWYVAFASYGCVKTATDSLGSYLEEAPKASTTAGETHSSMVLGPNFSGPITYALTMKTVAQTRVGSTPNPWETAWVAWNYTDDAHFYYLVLKTNGWELGKEDPAYPGAQRYLATGSSPTYPIGVWRDVRIEQDASNTIRVFVNGSLLTSFVDKERPYTSGRIAFYNEDARVQLRKVAVNAPTTASLGTSATGSVASKAP